MSMNILVDRMKLKVHGEKRDIRMDALTVHKDRSKSTPRDTVTAHDPWVELSQEKLLRRKMKAACVPMDYAAFNLGRYTRDLPAGFPDGGKANFSKKRVALGQGCHPARRLAIGANASYSGRQRTPYTVGLSRSILRSSIILLTMIFANPAFAGDRFYLGAWKIDSAVVAPWWADPGKPDPAESKTLLGKTATITSSAILAPGILACKGPKYKVVDVPAEGLFQGAFAEMRRLDRSQDPAKLAAQVGFQGKSWKSLQTGCANEIDFHFVDPNTAEFGLNNFVYTLRKL
jgi:hypothetical protein